jgi:hypothetical protein
VDGVTSARVRFRRRRVTAQVRLRPRTAAGAPDRVAEAIGRRLASFDLVRTPPVTVRAAPRGERGPARQGQDQARSGQARDGKARPGQAGHGQARQGRAREGKARQGRARDGRAGQGERRPKPFAARVDRLDRVLLTLFGLVLVAGGTVVLLAGFGVLGADTENATTLTPPMRSFAADNGWFWPTVGILASLVALAALTWLAAQFSTGRLGRLAVTQDAFGSAYIDGSAVADAVAEDADRDDGVHHASARLLGGPGDPLVRLVLAMEPAADVVSTRRYAEMEVLDRVRQALDRPNLRGQVELEPTDVPARRAR